MIDSTLDAMIRERIGPQRYGLFFSTGEGRMLPDGSEDSSGCVVTADDEHYEFWTGWDQSSGRRVFTLWERLVSEDGLWRADEEYREARQAAGLTV